MLCATFRPILRTICVSLHNAVEFAFFKSAQTQSVYNIEFGKVTTANHFSPYASFNRVKFDSQGRPTAIMMLYQPKVFQNIIAGKL